MHILFFYRFFYRFITILSNEEENTSHKILRCILYCNLCKQHVHSSLHLFLVCTTINFRHAASPHPILFLLIVSIYKQIYVAKVPACKTHSP